LGCGKNGEVQQVFADHAAARNNEASLWWSRLQLIHSSTGVQSWLNGDRMKKPLPKRGLSRCEEQNQVTCMVRMHGLGRFDFSSYR
tara:strand:+ start:592 stop:849 length:258 start_codon:yes stop_codon:yes gene_type:complete